LTLIARDGWVFTQRQDDLIFGMLDWTECKSVESVPGRVSGAFVFKGTRLPVATLFQNLEAGGTVDDFLKWYEGVTREQVLDVLRHGERSLAAG
jgi:uncharacterized protein (DUF433 family)